MAIKILLLGDAGVGKKTFTDSYKREGVEVVSVEECFLSSTPPDAAIIMGDVGDRSLSSFPYYFGLVRRDLPVVLVGNKADIHHRSSHFTKGLREIGEREGFAYFPISCRTLEGVRDVYKYIERLV